MNEKAIKHINHDFSVIINEMPHLDDETDRIESIKRLVEAAPRLFLKVDYNGTFERFEIDSLGMKGSDRRGEGTVIFGNQYAKSVC